MGVVASFSFDIPAPCDAIRGQCSSGVGEAFRFFGAVSAASKNGLPVPCTEFSDGVLQGVLNGRIGSLGMSHLEQPESRKQPPTSSERQFAGMPPPGDDQSQLQRSRAVCSNFTSRGQGAPRLEAQGAECA